MPPPALSVRRYSSTSVLRLSSSSCPTRARRAAGSSADPGAGSPPRSTTALPRPATPSLCLTIACVTAGLRRAHPLQRRDDAVDVGDVLPPERVGHAGLGEQPPAAGLGPEAQEPRVRAVQRDPEREREVALRGRRREGDEMAARAVGDARPDRLEHPRSLEQLRAQRSRGAVVRGDHVQAGARVARDDAGQQREVVLDDLLAHRAPGHVDQLQARLAEQEEQEEQALLVRLHHRPVVAGRRGDRGDDDDRLPGLVQAASRATRRRGAAAAARSARSAAPRSSSLRRGWDSSTPLMRSCEPRRVPRRRRRASAWRTRGATGPRPAAPSPPAPRRRTPGR